MRRLDKRHLKTKLTTGIFVKLSAALICIAVFFAIPSLPTVLDQSIEAIFINTLKGNDSDSNIVVVELNSEDINTIGWPVKRSYYALLIDYLNKLNVKKIGLEIFLSKSQSSQSVYNELLADKISSAGNVVLSSVFGNVDNGGLSGTGLEKPQLIELDNSIPSGHINLILERGVFVPNRIEYERGVSEPSFAAELAGTDSPKLMKINFRSAPRKLNRISLLEFFAGVQSDSTDMSYFEGKIVIIGVTDPSLAKSVSVHGNDYAGVFVHAQAVQNLINSSFYITETYFPSAVIFIALLTFLFITAGNRKPIFLLPAAALVLIVAGGASYMFFNLEVSFSAAVIPTILYLTVFFASAFFTQSQRLTSIEKMKEQLEEQLKRKESELDELLQLSNQSTGADETTAEKLAVLKKEIVELRERKDDFEPLTPDDQEVQIFEGMVYKSRKMGLVADLIKKVSPQDATVLIQGESGSGKELVAAAIHKLSSRAGRNFLAVNCAALSEQLLESELFGHVKGAFTNASGDKQGLFEAADKGTILLDEIGETSDNFQAKLLRVIQSGEIHKVGSTKAIVVDVRIIAATNKNLTELVNDGKFREDLYYRLNVVTISMPALRERIEDVIPLAEYFLQKEASELRLSKRAAEQLENYHWRGNVRELESAMKRAAIFASSEKRGIITVGDLPPGIVDIDKSKLDEVILESLRAKEFSHSSVSETAYELGGYNRTVVSENFRGLFFKSFYEAGFEIEPAVDSIAGTGGKKIRSRVRAKAEKYLQNVRTDVVRFAELEFTDLKEKLNSKYKNLPQKFHVYLDSIIKHFMN